jgi:Asp-tRNA(Asn)/Glu-tRNA(Gln) amidotransferase A subunit family amidase
LDGLAKPLDIRPRNLKGLKIGVPSNYFLDHLHDDVRANFEDAMERAASEGCVVKSVKVEEAKHRGLCTVHHRVLRGRSSTPCPEQREYAGLQ